jgi:Tol biopolymer transport system component
MVMNADGSNQVRLTTFPGSTADEFPAWSPDGAEIAFTSTNTAGFLLMDPSGGNLRNLAFAGRLVFAPDWSPDGTRIAGDTSDIWIINRDGTGPINLTNSPSPGEYYAAWSPDGTKIAFDDDSDIWVMSSDGTNPIRLTSEPGSDFQADWQPILGPQRSDYKNAAQFCKAEREFLGDEAFRNRYGGGANAYGKCVSGR